MHLQATQEVAFARVLQQQLAQHVPPPQAAPIPAETVQARNAQLRLITFPGPQKTRVATQNSQRRKHKRRHRRVLTAKLNGQQVHDEPSFFSI
jgi:hypothetical protein